MIPSVAKRSAKPAKPAEPAPNPRLRRPEEHDATVKFVVACIDYYRWVIPYEWCAAGARRRGGKLPQSFIALYAAAWLGILTLVFVFVPDIANARLLFRIIFAGLPIWCISEVMRWWLSVLLNRHHNLFASLERNLIYVFVNLAEVFLAGAVLLRMASPGHPARRALFDSFFLSTQLNTARQASLLHDAAQVLTVSASLVLLAGGLAVLIGGKASYYYEDEHEGPWVLPVPGQPMPWSDEAKAIAKAKAHKKRLTTTL